MALESAANLAVESPVQARYEALFRVSRTIGAHRDPTELFQSLAGELQGVIEFDVLYCTQYDPAGEKPSFCVLETPARRLPPPDFEAKETLTAWVYEHQTPLIIPFLERETRFPRVTVLLESEGIRSLVAVPLRTAHRWLGCFSVGSRQPNAFSQEEIDFLSLVAGEVALAIDDAYHFEALQQERDRLRMLLDTSNAVTSNLDLPDLLRAISANLRSIMQSEGAGVALMEPEGKQLRLCVLDSPSDDGHIPEGEILPEDSSAVQAARTRQPVVQKPDRNGTKQSVCSVPLISRERVLGTLGVKRNDPFSAQDVNFLKQVAGPVAIAVENAMAYGQIADLTDKLAREKVYLEDEIRSELNFEEIIGRSEALRAVLQQVETVAPTDSTVLIYGETGTGKELIARAIHDLSSRAKNAFVKLNCAAIPTGLLESEMFGHERGAFTGAIAQRIGRFELASRGTVFLDEIGEIPLELQPKLLRVLQEREFERLGSSRTLKSDARLIAATNRDLAEMVADHEFRADLFYRLNVFPIQLPPLRERREDIPLLVRHFARQFSRRMNRAIDTIPSETMSVLVAYHWPGNIRELQNLVERAVILSTGPVLNVPLSDLRSQPQAAVPTNTPANGRPRKIDTLEEVERRHVLETLEATDWVVGGPKGAAVILGLKRSTLQVRMEKLGIRRARAAE
ncbi:MAG TPA: sigma 54-interacting transcriptional regulator [Bryobacteraceae bacterium]|nr:sigma 54-interacting transcriptional regulator [Bryobacteraceae bacterium]